MAEDSEFIPPGADAPIENPYEAMLREAQQPVQGPAPAEATRAAWDEAAKARHAAAGAEQVGGGTFLPVSAEGDYTMGAVASLVDKARQPDGTIAGGAAVLKQSSYWNELARGAGRQVRPDQPAEETGDPVVLHYINQRRGEVAASARELQQEYGELSEQLKQGITQGVAEGYIPEQVLGRVEAATSITAIQVADSEILYAERPGLQGDYNTNDRLRIGHELSGRERAVMITHEQMHKLSGGAFQIDPGNGEVARTRLGFQGNSGDDHYGLNEAVNHHLALAALDGDFATLDPDEREDGDKSRFYAERKLLAAMVERSGGAMQVKTITRGSFEDVEGGNVARQERRAMVSESRQAYGAGAWRKFDLLCRAADTLPAGKFDEELPKLMDRIHAPVMKEDGTVGEPGSIDVEGL